MRTMFRGRGLVAVIGALLCGAVVVIAWPGSPIAKMRERTNGKLARWEPERQALAAQVEALSLSPAAEKSSGLSHPDEATAREAVRKWVAKGKSALPELRALSASANSTVVRNRAEEAIGGITGSWGSRVGMVWDRSLSAAVGKGKPILMLHLIGKLDEEFC